MKKTIVLLILLFLSGCQNLPDRRGFMLGEYGKFSKIKYVNNDYFVEGKNSIDILRNNRFEKYIENNENRPYLYINSNNVYIGYYGNDYKTILGELSISDEKNMRFRCENSLNDGEYTELSIVYNDDEIFKLYKKNSYPYDKYAKSIILIDDNLYLILLEYNSSPPYIDETINGPDYVGSELFRLDIENKDYTSIYTTDKTKAIAYGNENVIYYVDDKYDVYRLELSSNKSELVYDSKSKNTIYVEHSHGKLFIFEDDDTIGAIDVDK